ncbi:hypothetical protein TcG_08513 [Trypanosoma cruzi]|uniref:RING-type domain-containing protein n=1 Tax=Trypanosoma cruzi TaxID=5693 RepID=A0A2V2UTT6_TRYCR|nr:hypothetical protein TcBrA4_0083170 [Trypanosoma cruzi]PBJ70415.1 hypothetical protein BCY84_18869 [Trypanosoma cruzi cruzi]PWU86572.1 hypothetical protein C4B63_116g9 [Trypanosoma cruzi]RNF13210.1 hypothetical protein TcG_08513 [Trypanosoma cruzi]
MHENDMIETIVLVPVGLALWALGKRQAKQQELISRLQTTIGKQREELDRLLQTENATGSARLVTYSILVALGVYGSFLLTKCVSLTSLHRGCDLPPTEYAPTTARHEGEECVVCMLHRRDTLFDPCRHLCVCWLCSRNMQSCPVCRRDILRRQFAFIS